MVAVFVFVIQRLDAERGREKELKCETVSGATSIEPLVTTHTMICKLKLIIPSNK
jgi:hypothetical protein